MGLRGWWTEGEEIAEAVYRAHLAIPITILTAIMLVEFTILPKASKHLPFFLTLWIVFAMPLAIRHRRAAIFTKDTFIFRPVFGQLLRVPLAGIKRAYWIDRTPGDRRVPLCIELLVGGQLEILLGVRNANRVLDRLQQFVSETATHN
jgi:hypothetical protein